ncbi:hypothetical protein [Stenotrophomonas sp. P5_B8]
MLIGHRYERTPGGDLHIHSHNRVQAGLVLFVGAVALAVPGAFVVGALVNEHSPLSRLAPLSWLLVVLAFLLLVALAVVLLVYTETSETLTLSRRDGVGQRHTRTLSGRCTLVNAAFALHGLSALQLRWHGTLHRGTTQLWLVRHDGSETLLTPGNVAVLPGTRRTDRWLGVLADYLQLPVPVEVLDPPHAAPAQTVEEGADKAPSAADKAGAGVRLFFGLLGAFLAVLELTQLLSLVTALATARIRVGGYRVSAHTYYWSEQPLAYAFNVLFGVAMVVLVGMFAIGCLRLALFGRIRSAT